MSKFFRHGNIRTGIGPGKVGTMAGLTVGLTFGMGAIGSVSLGAIADIIGIESMIKLVGFLPLLGIISILLPI